MLERWEWHRQKVNKIVAQIREKANSNDKISLQKDKVEHTVPGAERGKEKAAKIDIKELKDIIEINPQEKICIAESGVTFSDLVQNTLKHNLVPYCVSELKDITIGGAISGCSVESLSFRYGGFHDSCLEYEVITGNGDIINVSPSENEEIFDMMHGAFGTLGILSLIKFKLYPAKPFVQVDYVKYETIESYMDAIYNHYKTKDVEFMDGIIHGPQDLILCIGKFVEQAPYSNTYMWNVYYKSTLKRKRDYIPTYDYFFRYDADCHWSTRNYYLDNDLVRFLLGPIAAGFILGSRNIIKLAKNPLINKIFPQKNGPDVIVDVFIPYNKLVDFYDWYLEEFNYHPVWIVPYYMPKIYPWINPNHVKGIKENFFIDFAIYGFKQPDNGKNYYKILESKVKEFQGVKTLISHNYYSKEDFWEIHNKDQYDKIKKIVDPNNLFNNLYDKMVPPENRTNAK